MSEPAVTSPPPRAALVLGYAGLLPSFGAIFAYLYLVHTGPVGPGTGMLLLGALVYAGLILSFLGGTWWGAAARLDPAAQRPWLVTSVMPTLVALPALLAAFGRPAVGGALLGIALACGLALLTMVAGLLA